jgi:hypothetical protein
MIPYKHEVIIYQNTTCNCWRAKMKINATKQETLSLGKRKRASQIPTPREKKGIHKSDQRTPNMLSNQHPGMLFGPRLVRKKSTQGIVNLKLLNDGTKPNLFSEFYLL